MTGSLHIAIATGTDMPMAPPDDPHLADALRDRGAEVSIPAWNDPAVDWSVFDLIVIRSTWDYEQDPDGWFRWLREVSGVSTLVNDAQLVAWNTVKTYLGELGSRGVPTVPTEYVVDAERDAAFEIAGAKGWQDFVVKPAVSVGAHGLERHVSGASGAAPGTGTLEGTWLVQPFLAEIEATGEVSIACIEGVPMHVWRKLPRDGDFRVQEQYGGTWRSEGLEGWKETAARVLAALDVTPVIARVDVIETAAGALLSELEAIEPQLFLPEHPETTAVLADALVSRASGRG